ncbi:MAG: PQQ-binding-like beta-propeller repeat protein [Bacteroidota bacterium]
MNPWLLFFLLCFLSLELSSQENSSFTEPIPEIEIMSGTYLGNENRNFYGNKAPDDLDIIWRFHLGKGHTANPRAGGKFLTWYGGGWTCQAATIRHDSIWYLIQPSYGQKLYKLNAETGDKIWEYKFDDVLKASPTIWENAYNWNKHRHLILQGSRRGNHNSIYSDEVYSLRAIDFITGEAVWKHSVERSRSYSRDVDASPLVIRDTMYAPLENGYLLIADPQPDCTTDNNGTAVPEEISHIKTYAEADADKHRNNVILEGSPTYFNDYLYMCSGTGWLYGYNIKADSIDWGFYTGGDMDGTPPVTSDSCLLVSLEKQYIPGQGGVFKIDPRKTPDSAVVWFFPTQDTSFVHWDGGIIGSPAVNDYYTNEHEQKIAVFTGLDGYLYVVDHEFTTGDSVPGPMEKRHYPTPQLISKHKVGPTISTPIITENKIIAATYHGIHLFSYDKSCHVELIAKHEGGFESTPVLLNGKLYISSRDGYLYCFGKKDAVQ